MPSKHSEKPQSTTHTLKGELIMSDELPVASDNLVVASEVMFSAIRILTLLDLDDQQIADLFIAGSKAGTALDHSPHVIYDQDDEEDVTGARPWRLDTLAENESFSKEVDRFAKRVSVLRTDQEPGPAEVRKLAYLCLRVIPAFAAAQLWYREQCAEQGLEVRDLPGCLAGLGQRRDAPPRAHSRVLQPVANFA
jgi:hypothetical protein